MVSIATGAQPWDAYVDAHPDATAYHQWRWRHVFERVFNHQAIYLIAHRGNRVVGVLPLVEFRSWLFGRFAVSLPFVDHGGILADDRETGMELVQHAAGLARAHGCAHVELRHRARLLEDLPCRQHKVAMRLPLLADAESMWSALDRKVRNQVRKAMTSGLVVARGGRELLPEFYRVFARNMRDLGTPVYPRRLFEEVFAQFPLAMRVFLVRHNGTAIAGGITCQHRDRVEVPWASSLAAARSMCPNNLLYWRIIEWAVHERFRTLDFGRSTPNGGTYRFKRQFGALPQPLCWEYALLSRVTTPDQGPTNPRFRRAIALWKHLPIPLTNLVGPAIVRSIP
jgi:serine/alanine adding enzyme